MVGGAVEKLLESIKRENAQVHASPRRVTITFTDQGRRLQLQIPAAEAPEVLLEVKPELVKRKPLKPRLECDYDEQGRLVLKPRYGDRAQPIFPIKGTRWCWTGEAFQKLGVPDRKIARFFDPRAKLIYEGDEIVDFLKADFTQLMASLNFRASERVKKSRVVRPRIASMKVKMGIGRWNDVDLKFSADQHTVALAEILQTQGKLKYIRKGDVWVEVEQVEKLMEEEGVELHEGRPVMPKDRRPRFHAVEIEKIRDLKPGPEPNGYRSRLRAYQRTGYDWLWWLRESGFCGILADDMGLGKTHQTMALLLSAYENGARRPSLVVCPASVVDGWYRKIKEFGPTLMPYVHHGQDRLESADDFQPLRVVLTTFGLLIRDAAILEHVDWEYVILDEAHLIKNPGTSASRAARRLKAAHRLALTGTPIENRPIELWSIFDFLMPGYLGTLDEFKRNFETPILQQDTVAMDKLRERIYPFCLRRLKSEVLDELPPKQEDKVYCDMTPHQEALYKAVIERSGAVLNNLADDSKPIDYIHVFATLTRLKQICDHPALAIEGADPDKLESGKFETFKELLGQSLDSGQKVVVFSQFVEMLKIIERYLESQGIGYASLHGGTRDRAAATERFRTDSDCKVFVSSLLAGGVGIDLQGASVVVHYDRWWNKAKEDQATDRVHRLGQTRGVQVFKLITRGSLEEKIDKLISTKGAVFDGLIQAEQDISKALTRQEMLDLLGKVA